VEVRFSVEAGAAKGERWLIVFFGFVKSQGFAGVAWTSKEDQS
jgi:hypothetical protein